MKNKNIILLLTITFVFFLSMVSFSLFNVISDNGSFERQVLNHLEAVAYAKAEGVGTFLDYRKNDLEFLSLDDDVIDAFKSNNLSVDIEDKLEHFQNNKGYLDLIFISIDGKILWNSNKDFIGINLSNLNNLNLSNLNKSNLNLVDLDLDDYSLNDSDLNYIEIINTEEDPTKLLKLTEIYNKVKNDFGVGIFDPGYYTEDKQLSVYVTTPVLVDSETVYGKKEIIGIIALQIDNSQIEEMVISDVGLNSALISLVNRKGVPINKLIGTEGNQIEEIGTKLYFDCFEDYNNYYFSRRGEVVEEVPRSDIYESYSGDTIFGSHKYVLQTGWCVLVELDKDETINKFWGNKI